MKQQYYDEMLSALPREKLENASILITGANGMIASSLAETLIRLREIGLTAVFHVHDEVIVEVDRPEQLDDVLEIMARPLSWAPGLPLKGAGFTCEYYQKD